jgi:hypothetical protein
MMKSPNLRAIRIVPFVRVGDLFILAYRQVNRIIVVRYLVVALKQPPRRTRRTGFRNIVIWEHWPIMILRVFLKAA